MASGVVGRGVLVDLFDDAVVDDKVVGVVVDIVFCRFCRCYVCCCHR